jgi:hypothetical protein
VERRWNRNQDRRAKVSSRPSNGVRMSNYLSSFSGKRDSASEVFCLSFRTIPALCCQLPRQLQYAERVDDTPVIAFAKQTIPFLTSFVARKAEKSGKTGEAHARQMEFRAICMSDCDEGEGGGSVNINFSKLPLIEELKLFENHCWQFSSHGERLSGEPSIPPYRQRLLLPSFFTVV